jgi:hypothetical protein
MTAVAAARPVLRRRPIGSMFVIFVQVLFNSE